MNRDLSSNLRLDGPPNPAITQLVLPNSKEGRSMEPRRLRLPGFTRFWALEFRRVRFGERQALRMIRQRVFVPIRAVEQQHALIPSDETSLEAPAATPREPRRLPDRAKSHRPEPRREPLQGSSLPAPRSQFRHWREPRAGSGSRRPPWARGCRSRPSPHVPSARRIPRPASNARTIGAQPSACTATIRGRLRADQPTASNSSNAFHMPIRPVPPPVG